MIGLKKQLLVLGLASLLGLAGCCCRKQQCNYTAPPRPCCPPPGATQRMTVPPGPAIVPANPNPGYPSYPGITTQPPTGTPPPSGPIVSVPSPGPNNPPVSVPSAQPLPTESALQPARSYDPSPQEPPEPVRLTPPVPEPATPQPQTPNVQESRSPIEQASPAQPAVPLDPQPAKPQPAQPQPVQPQPGQPQPGQPQPGQPQQSQPQPGNPQPLQPTPAQPAPRHTPEPPVAPNPPAVQEPRSSEKPVAPPLDIPGFALAKTRVATGLKPFPDGIAWLKANGYRSVLHVRPVGEDDRAAQEQFRKHGLNYQTLEVTPGIITKDSVEAFNRFVTDQSKYPLFVFDKDGAMVGALWLVYFRLFEGVSEEKARLEAVRLGWKPDLDPDHKAMAEAVARYLRSMNP